MTGDATSGPPALSDVPTSDGPAGGGGAVLAAVPGGGGP